MGTTRNLAITGTDGTGKTTVIRRLQKRYADRPHQVRAFRAPQYHEDPDLPFGRLSTAIEATSQLADQRGDLGLKATALFLSMTLFGDVARHVASSWRPTWVVTERQCLADSLVYARFYLPILGADLDEAALRDPISEAIGADSLAALERWTATLPRRLGEPEGLPFWSLPTFMRELFSVPPEHLLPRLAAMYQAELPDRLLILTASAEALEARLQAKHRGATPRELHEQAHVIAMFQEGLHAAGAALQQADPKLAVVTLDTTDQTPEQTEAWIATRLEENWR